MSEIDEKATEVLAGMLDVTALLRERGRHADAHAAERLHAQYARWAEGMLERLRSGAPVIDLERRRRGRA